MVTVLETTRRSSTNQPAIIYETSQRRLFSLALGAMSPVTHLCALLLHLARRWGSPPPATLPFQCTHNMSRVYTQWVKIARYL